MSEYIADGLMMVYNINQNVQPSNFFAIH